MSPSEGPACRAVTGAARSAKGPGVDPGPSQSKGITEGRATLGCSHEASASCCFRTCKTSLCSDAGQDANADPCGAAPKVSTLLGPFLHSRT